jgi:hypothetical protein
MLFYETSSTPFTSLFESDAIIGFESYSSSRIFMFWGICSNALNSSLEPLFSFDISQSLALTDLIVSIASTYDAAYS